MNRQSTEYGQDSDVILFAPRWWTRVVTPLSKHRMYDAKGEPECKLQTSVTRCGCSFTEYKKLTPLMGDVDGGRLCVRRGAGGIWGISASCFILP